VQLHSREIGYQNASFSSDGKAQDVQHINFNVKKQIVDFVFEEEFAVGQVGQLVVEYNGILNNQMAGFYRSTYNDVNGNEKVRIFSNSALFLAPIQRFDLGAHLGHGIDSI
jgi:hypothetical protein